MKGRNLAGLGGWVHHFRNMLCDTEWNVEWWWPIELDSIRAGTAQNLHRVQFLCNAPVQPHVDFRFQYEWE